MGLLRRLFGSAWENAKAQRLKPKAFPGPETELKEFPLLYLYFDDFAEMLAAWQNGCFEAARHSADERSCSHTIEEIMSDPLLFARLYREDLIRLKLDDGTVLRRAEETEYWQRATENAKKALPDNIGPGVRAIMQELNEKMDARASAIRRRYGMPEN